MHSSMIWKLASKGFAVLVVMATINLWYHARQTQIYTEWILFACTGILLLAFVPWRPMFALGTVVILEYGPERYNKNILSLFQDHYLLEWIIGLSVLGWSVWLLRREWRPLSAKFLISIALTFFIWLMVSEAVALLSGAEWYPIPGRHNPLLFMLGLILLLIAAQEFQLQSNSWVFALILATVVSIRVFFVGKDGIHLDEDIATLCALTIPLALFGAIRAPYLIAQLAFVIAIGTMSAVLMISQNRTGVVALIVVALFLFWQIRKRKVVAASALILLVTGFGLAVASGNMDRFKSVWSLVDKSATAYPGRGSIDRRLSNWKMAYFIARDNPVFGIGIGMFPLEREQYRKKDWFSREGVHNNYLKMLVETGLIGFALYVTLFGAGLFVAGRITRTSVSEKRLHTAGFIQASLAGFLVVGFFINRQDMVLSFLLLGWIAGLATATGRRSNVSPGLALDAAGELTEIPTVQDLTKTPETNHST